MSFDDFVDFGEDELEDLKGSVSFWRAPIHLALLKAGIYTPQELESGAQVPSILALGGGQNPVFWVDQDYVIKFYSIVYGGEGGWRREQETLEMLSRLELPKGFKMEIPEIVGAGHLFKKKEVFNLRSNYTPGAWTWPFVVQSFVRGRPIADLRPDLSPDDLKRAAQYLGRALRLVHETPLDETSLTDPLDPWAAFRDYLRKQQRKAVRNYKRSGYLNKAVLGQIPSYLPSDAAVLCDETRQRACFLHGDLTEDNLLGMMERGKWVPRGLIDFGDALVGHRVYELTPIYVDIFKLDKSLLLELMMAYGLDQFDADRFAYTAMCFTVMHAQDAFRSIFRVRPDLRAVQDVRQLEAHLFALAWPPR